MNALPDSVFPAVPFWKITLLRIMFFLQAAVMGGLVWYQILFNSAGWDWAIGLSKSMLGALALLSLLGLRYPLQMLPLMIYELVWKTVWIMAIAFPAWLNNRMTADIEGLFYDCIGVTIVYLAIPWRYVFARFFAQPSEAWWKKA
ncbi:MAG: hypothetical protein KA233_01130 [Novosphingobium sp.]|jgi:hypothetical protein|nr:hypothetical protein [Novosphingobium sp.]MBP6554263.1 hypothetical protein [Novosphingobium sp.]